MLLNPDKAKTAELEAELALYREAGIEGIAEDKDLKNNAERAAEVTRLAEEHGMPVKVDEAFIEANPGLAKVAEGDGQPLTVGKIIFTTEDELEAAAEAHALENGDGAKEGDSNDSGASEDAPEGDDAGDENQPAAGSSAAEEEEESDSDEKELEYNGKIVISVTDAIANGRSYKDVTTSDGQTFRISPEEFKQDVHER